MGNKLLYLSDKYRANDNYKIIRDGIYNNRVDSKIDIFDADTGERLFEPLHNKTVIAGSALTAMKLFNLDRHVLDATPTYDIALGLDNGGKSSTPSSGGDKPIGKPTSVVLPSWKGGGTGGLKPGSTNPFGFGGQDNNSDGKPDAWDIDGDGKPDLFDTDGDGIPDAIDTDGDGKPDKSITGMDTNSDGKPDAWDIDGDGIPDVFDTDKDGIPDAIDTNKDGKPDAWDTNGDGKPDMWDTNKDGKPDAIDTDGDGKPDLFDTDGDGIPDSKDTDGDGLFDGDEIIMNLDPLKADTKGDGVKDGERKLEYTFKSNTSCIPE